jgi:hypothetical protein
VRDEQPPRSASRTQARRPRPFSAGGGTPHPFFSLLLEGGEDGGGVLYKPQAPRARHAAHPCASLPFFSPAFACSRGFASSLPRRSSSPESGIGRAAVRRASRRSPLLFEQVILLPLTCPIPTPNPLLNCSGRSPRRVPICCLR